MTATPTNKRNTSAERTPPIWGKAATPKMKDIRKQNKKKNSVKTFFCFCLFCLLVLQMYLEIQWKKRAIHINVPGANNGKKCSKQLDEL